MAFDSAGDVYFASGNSSTGIGSVFVVAPGVAVLQGITYNFTVVAANPALRTFGPDAWVGPDPIAITSSDPAAVLPASGKLELDSVGAFDFGSTSAPYIYYKVTGTTTFYGAFNTPGFQTVTVVDGANPSATATVGLNVIAFAPPAITTAPVSQTVAIGAAGSLWVAASGGAPLSYQWSFNGGPIAGATNSVLTLPSVSTASAGSYTVTVTNAVGSVTSPAAVLTTSGSGASPVILLQPRPVVVNGHGTVVFTAVSERSPASAVAAANGGPQTRLADANTYQWFFNGAAIPGATFASMGLGALSMDNDGAYTCLVSNGSGSVMTEPATLDVVAAHSSRLTNFACRAQVGSAVAIIGFVVSGPTGGGTRNFLVRASGPALSPFGLTGLLPDPLLQLDNTYGRYDSNAGWGGSRLIASVSSSLGAFAWPSGTSKDAALFETLPPGAYTAEISGASGDSGIALGEIYDASPAYTPLGQLMGLSNISMRAQVGTGSNIMIAGFTITGPDRQDGADPRVGPRAHAVWRRRRAARPLSPGPQRVDGARGQHRVERRSPPDSGGSECRRLFLGAVRDPRFRDLGDTSPG